MDILKAQKDYFSGHVGLSVFNVVGSPGSGKTTFIKTLISKLYDILPSEQIYYIYTKDVRDVFTEVNPDKKYNLYFVDDAGGKQASRRSMANEQIFKDLPEVRHIAEEVHGMKEGRLIIFLANHYPKHIDSIIRNFEKLRFFKDMNLQEEMYNSILETCDFRYDEREEVKDWVDNVAMEKVEALSKVLVVKKSGRWGWLHFSPEDGIEPDRSFVTYSIPDSGESPNNEPKDPDKSLDYEAEDLEELLETELDNMIKETSWSKYAKVLKFLREGKTSMEVAGELEDVSEGSVTHHKKKALGELRRRIGLQYEELVAEELKERGWSEVSRKGGTGEPDIVAKNPDGDLIAVSVKLYSYGRTRHTLSLEEFKPELNFKDNNDEAEAWLWYNNLDWGGRSGKVFFEKIPTALDRIVIKKDKGILRPD